jgi:predicted nucleic acid-binding protein
MKALIDTDVLLDVALARAPHAEHSLEVLRWAEAGGSAAVAWHSLADCAYLLKGGGRAFLQRLLLLVEVASVGSADARRALDLPMRDVDDAFQAAAALAWSADVIVTRNLADYRRSPVRALSPAAFIKQAGAGSP